MSELDLPCQPSDTAFSVILQDLVLPLLMHNTANRSGPLRRRVHIAGSCIWGCLALTAVVGAVYDLANSAKGLQFFQNASR